LSTKNFAIKTEARIQLFTRIATKRDLPFPHKTIEIFPHRWEDRGKIATVGENQMSRVLEWRERLENAHKQIHEAMTELITNKDYSEAERRLYAVDELMLDLIEEMSGTVVRSSLWS
jgi:hypothetical protein